MYKYLYQHASFSCCQYLNRVYFFSEWLTWRKTASHLLPSSNLSSPGWSHGDSCLEMESRKRFACDVLHNFTTHSSIVYDVTDTDCLSENGSTHGRVYYGFQMSIFNKEKSNKKQTKKKKKKKQQQQQQQQKPVVYVLCVPQRFGSSSSSLLEQGHE